MTTKAKERRAVLDQMLTARANIAPADRPALAPRHLGPIAEQANLYAEHVAHPRKALRRGQSGGTAADRVGPEEDSCDRVSESHDRSLLVHDPKFVKLTKSLEAHGQETPIRVRPVKDALPFEFEIVSGHRRHAACLALDASTNKGFPIIAIVDARRRRNP